MNPSPVTAPELRQVLTGGFSSSVHDQGCSSAVSPVPVLMLHGSGPGVSAWVNWRLVLPVLAAERRVLAPDLVGFGDTERPAGIVYGMDMWVQQVLDLLDALDLPQVDLVGNSFGGAVALAVTIRAPQRVRRLVLMGSVESDIRALSHETLVIHGREDRVIPLQNSLTLADWIPNSQLHVFGHCGHWAQIEHSTRFSRLLVDFFTEGDAAQAVAGAQT